MRIVVLGGTRFIGRAIVAELAAAGHELLVVHRGQSEPPDLPADASKARSLRAWEPSDPAITVRRSVRWHLEHPPSEPDPGFDADERALAVAI